MDEETIREVILKHVASDSTVLTYCWKPYKGALKTLEIDHETVKHFLFYKDPSTGEI